MFICPVASALFLKMSFLTQILRGDLGARLGALGLKAGLCDRAGGWTLIKLLCPGTDGGRLGPPMACASHIADPVLLNMAVKRRRFHTFFTIWTSQREPPLLRRMHPVQVSCYFGQIYSEITILHGTAIHLFAFFCPLFASNGKR